MASAEPRKLNSTELKPTRRILFGLLVVNFIIYVAILIHLCLDTKPEKLFTAIYSIPIIAAFYIVEGSLFFGCQAYEWSCSALFHVICVLHNFGYFNSYAVEAADSKGDYLNYDPPVAN